MTAGTAAEKDDFTICVDTIVESDEVIPGIIADFDSEENVIGIEWY